MCQYCSDFQGDMVRLLLRLMLRLPSTMDVIIMMMPLLVVPVLSSFGHCKIMDKHVYDFRDVSMACALYCMHSNRGTLLLMNVYLSNVLQSQSMFSPFCFLS